MASFFGLGGLLAQKLIGGGGHKKDAPASTAPSMAGAVDPATGMPAAKPLQRVGAGSAALGASQQL